MNDIFLGKRIKEISVDNNRFNFDPLYESFLREIENNFQHCSKHIDRLMEMIDKPGTTPYIKHAFDMYKISGDAHMEELLAVQKEFREKKGIE